MSNFIQYFEREFSPLLGKEIVVAARVDNSDANNLGRLKGIDLDSPNFKGYIYYWENGFLDYGVYNVLEDKEEMPVIMIETMDFKEYRDKIYEIVRFFVYSHPPLHPDQRFDCHTHITGHLRGADPHDQSDQEMVENILHVLVN